MATKIVTLVVRDRTGRNLKRAELHPSTTKNMAISFTALQSQYISMSVAINSGVGGRSDRSSAFNCSSYQLDKKGISGSLSLCCDNLSQSSAICVPEGQLFFVPVSTVCFF